MASAPTTVVRAATVLAASGPLSPGEVVVRRGIIVEVRPATGPVTHEILAPGFVDLQMNGIGAVDVADADGDDWDVLDARPPGPGGHHVVPDTGLGGTGPDGGLRGPDRPGRGPAPAGPAGHRRRPSRRSLPGRRRGPSPGVAPVPGRRPLAGVAPRGGRGHPGPRAPRLPSPPSSIWWRPVCSWPSGIRPADVEVARRAADAGARLVTHLGNAMGPLRQREPGLLGAALWRRPPGRVPHRRSRPRPPGPAPDRLPGQGGRPAPSSSPTPWPPAVPHGPARDPRGWPTGPSSGRS